MPTLSLGFRAALSSRLVRSVMVFMLVLHCVVGPHETTSRADDAVAADEDVVRVFVGTVVDDAGAPVANALVEWGHFAAKQSEREFTFTNAAGEYRLETARAWQDFRLGVHKPGYGPRWVDSLIPARDGSVVDFVMPPTSDLVGVVVDPHGEPMPDMRVTAQVGEFGKANISVQPSSFPGPGRVATTNERGEFVLRDLSVYEAPEVIQKSELSFNIPMEDVRLTFRHGRKWLGRGEFRPEDPVRFQVSAGDMPVTPQTEGVVRGRVVDAQTLQPVTEFRVVGQRDMRKIAPEEFDSLDGEFRLSQPALRGIEYPVEVFAPEYAPGSAIIVAGGVDEKPQVEIRLERHPPIQCEVVDATTGEPLADVEVYSGSYEDDGYQWIRWSEFGQPSQPHNLSEKQLVVTDSQGRATFLEGQRPHTFFVRHDGYARTIVEPEERESLLTEEKVLRIALAPESGMSGRIWHEPIRGTTFGVHVATRGGYKEVNQDFYGEVAVNEAGEFVLYCLSAGTYDVELYLYTLGNGRSLWRSEVKVSEGEQVQIDIGAPAGPNTLRGIAPLFAVVRLNQFEPEGPLQFAAYVDADGHFEIGGLPDGVFEVKFDIWHATQDVITHRQDYVEITGNTERDFTNVPMLEEF